MNPNVSALTRPAIALAVALPAVCAPETARAQSHSVMAGHGAMHVTKGPACACCGAWVAPAREAAFDVENTHASDITSAKGAADLPGDLRSCHTARIGEYTVEGHVPIAAIAGLLKDQLAVALLPAPGLSYRSPGRETGPAPHFGLIAFGGAVGAGAVLFLGGE